MIRGRRPSTLCSTIILTLISTLISGCDVKPTSLEEDSLTDAPIRDGSMPDPQDTGEPLADMSSTGQSLDADIVASNDGDIRDDMSDGDMGIDAALGDDPDLSFRCQPSVPIVERELGGECDGIDNDCDGFIDEHFSGQLEECGDGVCSAESITVCDNGVETSTCRDGEATGLDDTCDLVDDDCDGRVDESYINAEVTCGLGLCQRTAIQTCTPTGLQSACVASEPPEGELDVDCDGIDDDCDGSVDEGYQDEVVTCGLGRCFASGLLTCNLGALERVCEPGAPEPDTQCDGEDNDCDGRIDEAFSGDQTSCGEGVCRSTGRIICAQGEVTDTCTPSSPISAQDLCDGLDTDCDGLTDEDHVESITSCGEGACARSGVLRCQDAQVRDTCAPGDPLPSDSECDALDQDCDGQTDEGYQGVSVDCGVGACAASALTTCVMGEVRDNCVAEDSAEIDDSCDGVDQDCDGRVDEDYQPTATLCGVGSCLNVGETSCVSGQTQDSCQPLPPSDDDDSQCDRVDSDCDGRVDEGYVVQLVTCGAGVCQTSGLQVCSDGGQLNQCSPLDDASPDTQCDGLDNDCDELIDEGYIDVASACGVGACQQTGVVICTSEGTTRDTCEALSPPPGDSDQTCDGIDSDCDGRVDEGYQSAVTTCGVGACARSGQRICQAGVITDTCAPADPAPTDDDCDLSDDDCDGQADEHYETQPITCMEGACSADGEVLCTAQGLTNTCVITVRADDPSCDGVDDDCDGLFDEDYVAPEDAGATVTCGEGVCQNMGNLACVQGSVTPVCEPLDPLALNDRTCDEVDDDCDGVTDEDFTRRDTCGLGVCRVEVDLTCNGGVISACIPRVPRYTYDVCGSRQDDNCDGVINPAYLNIGEPCSLGFGACRANGQYVCNGQLDGIVCLAETPDPKPEVCDLLDNDCDGIIDEFCDR